MVKSAMNLDTHVVGLLRRALDAKEPERQKLDEIVRLMAKWRSTLIQNTIVKEYGTAVQL